MPNIEIKARCNDLTKATATAKRLATEHPGLDHQIDTYFNTPKGRLKLRESSLSGAVLIPYIRSDTAGPKKSDYTLLTSKDPKTAKALLSQMLGVETVVEKYRDIYLIDNVRVHLDNVVGLGTFIEFEAVYQDPNQEESEHTKVRELIREFQIQESQLIRGSYREQAGSILHFPCVIREIKEERGTICNTLLRALPDWFGIESSIQQYVRDVDSMTTFAAFNDGNAIGFLSLNKHSASTSEIHVMAVSPEYHRKGIGRALIQSAEQHLRELGAEFLTVKTLSPSRECAEYERTRQFYIGMGFRVVEEFKTLWGAANPCLLMIKPL